MGGRGPGHHPPLLVHGEWLRHGRRRLYYWALGGEGVGGRCCVRILLCCLLQELDSADAGGRRPPPPPLSLPATGAHGKGTGWWSSRPSADPRARGAVLAVGLCWRSLAGPDELAGYKAGPGAGSVTRLPLASRAGRLGIVCSLCPGLGGVRCVYRPHGGGPARDIVFSSFFCTPG